MTCLPSSVEVEATVFGPDGLLEACHPGMIHVDSTTADPAETRRIAGEAMGFAHVEASPLTRSSYHARQGATAATTATAATR